MEFSSTEIYQMITESNNICVAGHINPDGDSISSALGMALCLQLIGKKVTVLLEKYSEKYDYIKGTELIYNGDYRELSPDMFIAVDCGSKDRLGRATEVFDRAKTTMCIDHHISNTNFAQNNIVYPDSSSASEVVFEVIKNFSILNKDIAEALYTGIISDTSGFKHSSTSSRTHEIASVLIKYGIPYSDIQDRILYSKSQNEVKIFTIALNKLKIENGYSYTTLSKEEIIGNGIDYNDLDSIVGFILNIEGVNCAAFLYEKADGTIKASLRSKNVNVSQIAIKYGGGGHKLAAGANFNCSMKEAKNIILNELKSEIEKING